MGELESLPDISGGKPRARALLARTTLIEVVRGSVGSGMFRKVYVENGGRAQDVLEDGKLSCAFFVSSVLAMASLIDRPHTVVEKTIKMMGESGWVRVAASEPGCVVRWPELDGHEHIGFCVGELEFVSNSSMLRSPQLHRSALPDGREPSEYYWHANLDS